METLSETFRRRPGRLLNDLRTFNIRNVSRGHCFGEECAYVQKELPKMLYKIGVLKKFAIFT